MTILKTENLINSNFKRPPIQQQSNVIPTTPTNSNTNDPQKRRGCRCGNATAAPGKLTCCGQRCPCYVDSKACIDCKCKGCRNPHYADGHKKVSVRDYQDALKNRFVILLFLDASSSPWREDSATATTKLPRVASTTSSNCEGCQADDAFNVND